MSKFSEMKIKYQDKENQWYENFNKKTGYKIWKFTRGLNWIILVCIIPFLPLIIYSLGFNSVGGYDATTVYWGFITTMVIFSLFVLTIIVQWWFSKFSDYLDEHE